MIQITDNKGTPLVTVPEEKLPLKVVDLQSLIKRSYYLKRGNKIGSGLHLNTKEK